MNIIKAVEVVLLPWAPADVRCELNTFLLLTTAAYWKSWRPGPGKGWLCKQWGRGDAGEVCGWVLPFMCPLREL